MSKLSTSLSLLIAPLSLLSTPFSPNHQHFYDNKDGTCFLGLFNKIL